MPVFSKRHKALLLSKNKTVSCRFRAEDGFLLLLRKYQLQYWFLPFFFAS